MIYFPYMEDTPMMKQYLGFKKQYPDKILLYRMGDFFESFGDDAKLTSKVLNITLTARNKETNNIPLAGFPHKAIDQYLPKLIEAGYCVVVVDQLEDPKFAKGIVKRGVTRIVTPGTLDGDEANAVKNSYLASFYLEKKILSISLCDVSTGEFLLITEKYTENSINNILSSYYPEEVLVLEGEETLIFPNTPVHFVSKNLKNKEYATEIVKDFYDIKNIESIDISADSPDIISVGMCLDYIKETQLMDPKHILKPKRVNTDRTMVLDRATIRNLELVASAYSGSISDSLFGVLDKTSTRMGRRLLYSWILNPLIDKKNIDERLNTVEKFVSNPSCLENVREALSNVNDIDRIVGKIGLNRANGRDFNALQVSLKNILDITVVLEKELKMKVDIDKEWMAKLIEDIEETIADDPPPTLTEGGIIKTGFNPDVDELRSISGDSKSWLSKFEEEEKARTGITSLKISFNKVFGYYIEVTNTHLNKVPERYIRKQTLVNAERFITEELKEKENIILNAQEKIGALEYKIFSEFRDTFIPYLEKLHIVAQFVANIDVLSNFAHVAIENNYVKPTIYEIGEQNGVLEIKKGRHPIVEKISSEEFISNDTLLNFEDSCMAILTGPNMSGKSTYIRQVASIVLMAQIGCFVSASEAKISIVDRIFTRVGASDDLSRGRSTFMVEMDEAANIINNATKYSLIILDEVGRGTSTYDGVSIAWAIAEYLVNEGKARTLFATHYHELLKLSEKFPEKVQNYNVLVEEDLEEGTVIFLRKIVKGGTDRSYGIYVAKMAGLPMKIIKRANEILESFEQKSMFEKKNELRESGMFTSAVKDGKKEINGAFQFPLFTAKDSEIEQEIQKLNLDNLTPLEALNKISEWKKKI